MNMQENIIFMARVKNAVRMRVFPASGADLRRIFAIEIIRDNKTN